MQKIKKMFTRKKKVQLTKGKSIVLGLLLVVCVYLSDLYLQYMQNDRSLDLALKFALSWHTEKFLLGTGVLLMLALFIISILGSYWGGLSLYLVSVFLLGIATYLKMKYRMEPVYPDDLKMVTQWSLLKDMGGTPLFVLGALLIVLAVFFALWRFILSFQLGQKIQILRFAGLLLSGFALFYAGNFNQSGNLLKKAYDRSALWIPYSQKMNYYNVGFVGGFLFNLNVPAMDQPAGYSKETMTDIVTDYQKKAASYNDTLTSGEDTPNIVFVMSESFSDGTRLKEFTIDGDPLTPYREVAQQTYSGQMLSPGYGGGTANIEFEALTSFGMELFNPQLTTPYTQLLTNFKSFPSIVSLLAERGYETTAIHPYNTSMYKRQDVYNVLGFDQFISQETIDYDDTLENNPYISDASAYQQVLDQLDSTTPQFIHLVTMQTHMPYSGKYDTLDFATTPANTSMENYYQDVHYAAIALQNFLAQLETSDQRTLVVFWGDHLPSIYSDAIQAANETANLHLTEFLFFDSQGQLVDSDDHNVTTSPFYFASELMQQAGLKETGFYAFLQALQEKMPAFESNMYYTGTTFASEYPFDADAEKLYETYKLIQDDTVSGKQYATALDFFKDGKE